MLNGTSRLLAAGLAVLLAAAGSPAAAQSISLRDSFPIGSGAGILCSATTSSADKALVDMFDRAYSVVCRDAAVPVGHLYALRHRSDDPVARLADLRAGTAQCDAPTAEPIADLGTVAVQTCRMTELGVAYRVYVWRAKGTVYVAEGLAGYDSALRLGLRTIVADKPVKGEVSIATTEAGDAASFARVQAGTLDPQRALAEAYRRNNAGSYAEAAEFFGSLLASGDAASRSEATLNQALQQSNLGNYGEANRLFASADEFVGGDAVLSRMLRNYRAIHQMNQARPRQALAELQRPLPAGAAAGVGSAIADLEIDAATAARLNADSPVARQLSAAGGGLLPIDKVQVLDAQAEYLRGTTFRLQGKREEAARALNAALDQLTGIRGGRLTSTSWMRAQLMAELAAIAEEAGDPAEAERQHRAAVALLTANYPSSSALLASQARLAAFYSRTGQTEPARTLFRQIVDANIETGNSSPTLQRTLAPYFALLAREASQPEAVAEFFKASQVLVRPGVAQTQAILARELSGGSDEASRLFRQSVTLTREIERSRIEISRLAALPQPSASEVARLAELRPQLEQMERDQVATQAKLADFPRYRVVSSGAMALADLQQLLREGEAYYKLIMVGDEGYAIFATPTSAHAFRLDATPGELDRQVDALRDTISKVENDQLVTYPFDVQLAHRLYGTLFQPIDAEFRSVRHLIFEPDGALLRLPVTVLVAEQAGVDAYLAKARRPEDDGFDFTDIRWLGRDRDVSTAVSARSFRDVRKIERSHAAKAYIGFGENAPPGTMLRTASQVRGLLGESDGCAWSIADWARPISAAELQTASRSLGVAEAAIITGEAFNDTAIKQRDDLAQYRIMHFATHGLVTAPRPECPARPALMTSFGAGDSDGLLSFREIYDLHIDADLVILSACDTAGKATVAATREAGVTTGGDQALDGLVRAFVGAGGRSVIASHWPVPDDYDATKRLIAGLFAAPPGTPIATALRTAEKALMDQRDTSHPYYWAGFAIIGDGAAAVVPTR